jgi:hypothetical protein
MAVPCKPDILIKNPENPEPKASLAEHAKDAELYQDL